MANQQELNTLIEKLRELRGESGSTKTEISSLESTIQQFRSELTQLSNSMIQELQSTNQQIANNSRLAQSYTQLTETARRFRQIINPQYGPSQPNSAITQSSTPVNTTYANQLPTSPTLTRRQLEFQQQILDLTTARRQRREYLQNDVFSGNSEGYNQFGDKLSKLGIGMNNITGVTRELSTGVTTVNAEIDKGSGITERATVHIDRYGRILQDTGGRFHNLGSLITRNIAKVLEWALALGVVYGGINKISQLVTEMQKMQDTLATISVTTGQAGKGLNDIFESVSKIADITGTAIAEGLTAMNLALKATGGTGDASQRSYLSVKLLADSMTLAKLSGIGQAEAMDILTASIKQMNLPLDQGSGLLNKFQAVANKSNSSILDMAQTFAITAGAASDVGVKTDELVGIIGAFAETTTLSATETGNALRAMFSNFTTDTAIKTLNKYGIAVQDLSGDFLSFTDVFKRASELARSGILDSRQIAEIANAIGGGSRRGAQVTALLTAQPRSEVLADISKAAKDEATKALETRTQTLSTAVIELNNSFEKLAQTLGTEGGFLSSITTIVNFMTTLLDTVNGITKALGPATQGIIAFGLAATAYSQLGPRISASFRGTSGPNSSLQYNNQGQVIGINQAQAAGNTFGQAALSNLKSGLPALLFTLAPQIISNMQSGNWDNVGSIAGTAIGGTIGAVLGGPIGALAGASIGAAIADKIKEQSTNTQLAQAVVNTSLPNITGRETPEQLLRLKTDLSKQLDELTRGGAPVFGPDIFGNKHLQGLSSQADLLKTVESLAKGGTDFGNFLPEDKVINKAIELYKLILETEKLSTQKGNLNIPGLEGANVNTDAIKSLLEQTSSQRLADDLQKQFEYVQKLQKGELTVGQYRANTEALSGSSNIAAVSIQAKHPEITKDINETKKYSDELLRLKRLIQTAPDDVRSFYASLVSGTVSARSELEEVNKQIEVIKLTFGASPDSKLLTDLSNKAKKLTSDIARAISETNALEQLMAKASSYQFPGFTESKDFSTKQTDQAYREAQALQQIFANQTGTTYQEIADSAQSFILETSDGFVTYEGLQKQFMDLVLQRYKDFNKQIQDTFVFQDLRNISASNASKIQAGINYYTQLLKKYGFNEKNELITVLFKDNQVGQLVGSQTALRLALEDNTEVVKKNTEGVYNIPSGAIAFVPATAASVYRTPDSQSTGGFPNYPAAPTPVAGTGGYSSTTVSGQIPPLDKQTIIDQIKADLLNSGWTPPSDKKVVSTYSGSTDYTIAERAQMAKDKQSTAQPSSPFNLNNLNSILGGLFGLLGFSQQSQSSGLPVSKGLNSLPVQKVEIYPQKQEQHLTAVVQLQVSGRTLADIVKPFLFEDYQQLSSISGSTGRQAGNILS